MRFTFALFFLSTLFVSSVCATWSSLEVDKLMRLFVADTLEAKLAADPTGSCAALAHASDLSVWRSLFDAIIPGGDSTQSPSHIHLAACLLHPAIIPDNVPDMDPVLVESLITGIIQHASKSESKAIAAIGRYHFIENLLQGSKMLGYPRPYCLAARLGLGDHLMRNYHLSTQAIHYPDLFDLFACPEDVASLTGDIRVPRLLFKMSPRQFMDKDFAMTLGRKALKIRNIGILEFLLKVGDDLYFELMRDAIKQGCLDDLIVLHDVFLTRQGPVEYYHKKCDALIRVAFKRSGIPILDWFATGFEEKRMISPQITMDEMEHDLLDGGAATLWYISRLNRLPTGRSRLIFTSGNLELLQVLHRKYQLLEPAFEDFEHFILENKTVSGVTFFQKHYPESIPKTISFYHKLAYAGLYDVLHACINGDYTQELVDEAVRKNLYHIVTWAMEESDGFLFPEISPLVKDNRIPELLFLETLRPQIKQEVYAMVQELNVLFRDTGISLENLVKEFNTLYEQQFILPGTPDYNLLEPEF